MKLAIKTTEMTTFRYVYFMPLKELTGIVLDGYKGSIKELAKVLDQRGIGTCTYAFSRNSKQIEIKGFSEEYSESHDQIEHVLEVIGIPKYLFNNYRFYSDRVWFESIDFKGVSILLTNFLSSGPIRPKWAQFKFVGEIVNYGNEIYALKLPKIKRDMPFIYPIAENEYASFRTFINHTFPFKDGMFIQIPEFPPTFLVKGFKYAVDFFESFLEINGFDLTDYGEYWFPSENQVKAFYL